MLRSLFLRTAIAAAAASLVAFSARAFDLTGPAWPDGNIVMHLQLGVPSTPLSDGSPDWNTVAEAALNDWNQVAVRSKFTVIRDSTAAIADGNRINNVSFQPKVYNQEEFGANVLAVTLLRANSALQSTERDVLFNSNLTWNSYRGATRPGVRDFRRVALHEFGHVLGLDHPDEAPAHFQNISAVMNSTISSIDTLQSDDIAGAKALYDPFPNSANTQSRVLPATQSFTLTVPTSGAGPFTYTWRFRPSGSPYAQEFPLATGGSYTIGSVQPADTGTYIATATGPSGNFFSAQASLAVTPVSVSTDTTLANLSTRGVVGTGGSVLIAGFVVGGTTPKNMLLRAPGPSLADFGVASPLADPTLSIVNSQSVVVAQNDNWESSNATAIAAATARLGAFQFKPGSRDSAILTTLPPGSYTAVLNGVNNTTGVALVEAYDADADPATARSRKLVNIATRGQVDAGENVLIAGLVVTGPGPRTYLVRAVGPTLARAPFNLTGVLADPFLQIYQGSTLLHENDDWDHPLSAQAALRDAATKVGAFALVERRPSGEGLDAALLITLQPGSYTAKVSGFEGATGVALVEVYEVP